MISPQQRRSILLLSDIRLYPLAQSFYHTKKTTPGVSNRLEQIRPVPTSQINQVLHQSVAATSDYSRFLAFVTHQISGRSWPNDKQFILSFYKALRDELEKLRKQANVEFHLLTNESSDQEKNEVMGLVTREFIQHLATENIFLETLQGGQRGNNRR